MGGIGVQAALRLHTAPWVLYTGGRTALTSLLLDVHTLPNLAKSGMASPSDRILLVWSSTTTTIGCETAL